MPKPSAAPVQQPGMARTNGAAGTAGSQTAAGAAGISAAEGEALRAAAAAAEQQRQAQQSGVEEAQGEGAGEDETAGTEFKAAEAKLMKASCSALLQACPLAMVLTHPCNQHRPASFALHFSLQRLAGVTRRRAPAN